MGIEEEEELGLSSLPCPLPLLSALFILPGTWKRCQGRWGATMGSVGKRAKRLKTLILGIPELPADLLLSKKHGGLCSSQLQIQSLICTIATFHFNQ